MALPKARKRRSSLPPNPAQWQPERNGIAFRQQFHVPPDGPLRPFELWPRIPRLWLLRRQDLEGKASSGDLSQIFVVSRHRWSAVTLPLNGDGHIIIMNDTHALTRQHATLMEELFHIRLGHQPSRIGKCPVTGLVKREYDKRSEQEAYWSAAAALVPYAALRTMVENARMIESIAEHFEVSGDLVAFRLKVTKLWRRTCR